MKTPLVCVAALALGLAACGTVPPSASLVGGQLSFSEPTRDAIFHTAYVFASPANLAGQPGEAALAVAQAEHLAVELPNGARWRQFSPLAQIGFERARPEWRMALGIAPQAEPQPVINALLAANQALRAGNVGGANAALSSPAFTRGPQATLAILAAMPSLPQTGQAALAAEGELTRSRGQRGRS